MKMKSVLPSFFVDDSETDKYESLVDSWLSWTFRCAALPMCLRNRKIVKYSRLVLSYCLSEKTDIHFLDGKKIDEIKCWRNYWPAKGCEIDLWVELRVDGQGYVLIFENKVHSPLTKWQLERIKSHVEKYYVNHIFLIRYIFFRAHDDYAVGDLQYCSVKLLFPKHFGETSITLLINTIRY